MQIPVASESRRISTRRELAELPHCVHFSAPRVTDLAFLRGREPIIFRTLLNTNVQNPDATPYRCRRAQVPHRGDRFAAAANGNERAEVRTFCLDLAYIGYRISEALDLAARHVDLERKTLTDVLSKWEEGPDRSATYVLQADEIVQGGKVESRRAHSHAGSAGARLGPVSQFIAD